MATDIPWVDLKIVEHDGGLRAELTHPDGRRDPDRQLPGEAVDAWRALASTIRREARSGQAGTLGPSDPQRAHALYEAVSSGIPTGTELLRLWLPDADLRTFPWEVMREGLQGGLLATHPTLRIVRGVYAQASQGRRVLSGGVRVLAVAPAGMHDGVEALREELAGPIGDGVLEWLPPVIGEAARWENLGIRLRSQPCPHVLHVIAHGRVRSDWDPDSDAKLAIPELQLGEGADGWVKVENLANVLRSEPLPHDFLRLVYLDSCAGARPGPLASAAELLVSSGVEAVIAHLWSVPERTARTAARAFYRALTLPADVANSRGDVARSLNRARESLLEGHGVGYLCPVLFLSGRDPRLFDFSAVRAGAFAAAATAAGATATTSDGLGDALAPLARVLAAPGGHTLFVGNHIDRDGRAIGERKLQKRLLKRLSDRGAHDALPTLMQRYELARSPSKLLEAFHDEISDLLDELTDDHADALALVDALVGRAAPGLAISLLWLPVVEEALVRLHPDRELIVLQRLQPAPPTTTATLDPLDDDDDVEDELVYYRLAPEPGGGPRRWQNLDALPDDLDLTRTTVVVRLFGGINAKQRRLSGKPVLTDDHQLQSLDAAEQLDDRLVLHIKHHPMAIVGLSPLLWSHRELLRRLTGGESLVHGSAALLSPNAGASERRFWLRTDVAGASQGVEVVEFARPSAPPPG